MNHILRQLDSLILRALMDQIYDQKKKPSKIKIDFSRIPGKLIDEAPVLLSELLFSSMKALAKAGVTLKKSQSLTLGNEPLEFKFTGELIGLTSDNQDILLRVSPYKKGENRG